MPGHAGWISARIEPMLERRDQENRASAARLIEYSKLKDEIANRSTLQNAIMTVNIAAVGTLGGFIFDHQVSLLMLLLLIPISTALGFWWLDHARTVDRIGKYIREELWPRIIEWPNEEGRPQSYEEIVIRTSAFDQGILIAPFLFMFIGPPVVSAVFVVTSHVVRRPVVWVLWAADVVVAVYLLANWIKYVVER